MRPNLLDPQPDPRPRGVIGLAHARRIPISFGLVVALSSCAATHRELERGSSDPEIASATVLPAMVTISSQATAADRANDPSIQTADFAHLPPQMTLVSDVTFDSQDKLPPTNHFDEVTRWRRTAAANRLDIGSAREARCSQAPFGALVLRGFVPAGFNIRPDKNGVRRPRGVGPWSMDLHFTPKRELYRRVYQSIWTAMADNLDVGANRGFKWSWFLGPPSRSRTNHFWAAFDANPDGAPVIRPRFVTQFNGLWRRQGKQYTSRLEMPYGRWHHVEMLFDAGSPGQSDGSFQFWLNGQLALNLPRIPILPPEATGPLEGFRGVRWNPTWGGEEGQPVDSYLCVARWAVFVDEPLSPESVP